MIAVAKFARPSSLLLISRRPGVLPVVCHIRGVHTRPSRPDDDDSHAKERRTYHQSARSRADATAEVMSSSNTTRSIAKSSALLDRFVVTAEVTISKIFPAGFGWQTAAILASAQGHAADSLNFALTTGLGDALGVFGGHMVYYTAKKSLMDSSNKINLTRELHTGILLGSAAFCSGTAWQPIVNTLQGANLPFVQVFTGTWMGCALAFYVGLRVSRTLLSGPFRYIHEPTYENGKNDVALSLAIGGATGFFVGTDAVYLPEQNFLIHLVGIAPGTPNVTAAAIAGSSTALGFMSAQTGMNFIYPTGKCWND